MARRLHRDHCNDNAIASRLEASDLRFEDWPARSKRRRPRTHSRGTPSPHVHTVGAGPKQLPDPAPFGIVVKASAWQRVGKSGGAACILSYYSPGVRA